MYEKKMSTITDGVKISVDGLQDGSNNIMEKIISLSKNKYVISKGEKQPKQTYFTMFVAELLGTGLLMFLGCMSCIVQDERTPSFLGPLGFGLTVMLIIQTLGHVSGAHLNPAVTVTALLLGKLPPLMTVIYIAAQFAGATLGFGLLKILVTDVYDGFCSTALKENTSVVQGFALEVVITTILVLVCCGVWDPRNASNTDSIPLRFGFTITVISIAAGPYTGASMNTARSFAPVIWGGNWTNQWIYWIGPNLAPFIGCGLYKFVFSQPETKESDQQVYLEEVAQKL